MSNIGRIIPSSEAAQYSVKQIFEYENTSTDVGLTDSQVERRRNEFGYNEFDTSDHETLLHKFLSQFSDKMILLLMVSAFISLLVGQYDDALSIFTAVVIVVTVGFIQEYRSEKSLEALNHLVPPMCQVIRNGLSLKLEAKELVVGDLVILSMGDRVPADLRLTECFDLKVNESSLTGENDDVSKTIQTLNGLTPSTAINKYKNIVFMGTMISNGHGKGIVISIGQETEFGKVFTMVKEIDEKRTPLQKRMDSLGEILSTVSLAIIVVITIIGFLQGRKIMEMFTIGVSLAVAAIPEGLPICTTVTLGLAVLRMVSKKVIVKKLPAVEALGCATIVCSDKTGTLTKNEMTVKKVVTTNNKIFDFSGIGYNSEGNVSCENRNLTNDEKLLLEDLLISSVNCCNYIINEKGDLIGQPTECAIGYASLKCNIKDPRSDKIKGSEITFNSSNKWMAIEYIDNNNNNNRVYYVKGASDIILGKCNTYWTSQSQSPLTDKYINEFKNTVKILSSDGLRVIAIAKGPSLDNLCFYGLIGIYDPPREGVINTLKILYKASVKVVMITGDSETTAVSIARELGMESIYGPLQSLSGEDIESYDINELKQIINNVSVFYRTAPKHKMKIVQAYQANGEVVAMTGDGVNDAPSLKLADIGVSMGKTGTDVSKEAADLILVDDNFTCIIDAIKEGRSTYMNIRNFVRFQLTTSIAALSLVALTTIFDKPNPLNAMQILWINILMDGPPAQSLGVEPVEEEVIKKRPRNPNEPILTKRVLILVLYGAMMILILTYYVFDSEIKDGKITARDTTMTFTTFVFCDLFTALSCRSSSKSIFSIGFLSNKVFVIAVGLSIVGQFSVIYLKPLQKVFQTEEIGMYDIFYIICLTSTIFILEEIRKYCHHNNVWNKLMSYKTRQLLPLYRDKRRKDSEADKLI